MALGFVPVGASAAVPAQMSLNISHPTVMQQAAQQVATAKTGHLQPFTRPSSTIRTANGGPGGPQREVFGFGLASSLVDPTYGYSTWDFSLLSTVAFFGLHVQDDGTFAGDSGMSVWNSSQLTGLMTVAHSHGTRVVVTIIMQDFSAGNPHMCAALARNPTTIRNAVAEMKAKGADGINVDFEGLNGGCGSSDPQVERHVFTGFVANLHAAMPAGSFLTVDTYASSASDPVGFYDIGGMTPSVDAFFVMAYDLEYSNYTRAPTGCSSFCLGPTAPLTGYHYNDYSTVGQYLSVTPASKVILGIPYYGRKACVSAATPNATPTGAVTADTYLDASGEATAAGVQAGSYATHRDANDPAGHERWDTWVNTTMNCTRELYWDDVTSLAPKYDLVNDNNLRGAGFWTLNYGGGAPELWQLIANKFGTTTSWNRLGGALTSAPDASSWGTARTDVFARGTDGALWQDTWNGSAWSSWASLGGFITADPSAVSMGPNRIDVFARGTDKGLWHRWWDGVRWSGWQSLGGGLTSGPDAASMSSNRLDVFARGNDNGLWHAWWDGIRWNGWQALGGVLTSDPSVVAGPGRLDIFGRGTDRGLWHISWDSTAGWSQWQSLGGLLLSGPDASSCAAGGHIDVFAVGGDSAMYRLGYTFGWGNWQRMGGVWTSDPSAVCAVGTTSVNLFARAPDNSLWQTSVTGS